MGSVGEVAYRGLPCYIPAGNSGRRRRPGKGCDGVADKARLSVRPGRTRGLLRVVELQAVATDVGVGNKERPRRWRRRHGRPVTARKVGVPVALLLVAASHRRAGGAGPIGTCLRRRLHGR